MTIQADIQKLSGEALIELFVLDATALGGTVSRFHAGSNQLKGAVVWQGQTYQAMPVEATGFEFTGKGSVPRPTLRAQNVDGLLGALCDTYDDLLGAKVTRKRTFAKYLDAVNFPGGVNAAADPDAAFPDDTYFINRKATHTKHMVEFELTASWDVHGVQLPRRQIIQQICTWTYRSAECSYAGGAVATIEDVPTGSLDEDRCGKRITSCKLRFGANGTLPFGGFPGAGVVEV